MVVIVSNVQVSKKSDFILKKYLATWAKSFTKLLSFNQTQYERLIHLDSDATLLRVCYSVHRASFYSSY